ncbi:MAG: thioesterase family protein [Motiliproteus sp.]
MTNAISQVSLQRHRMLESIVTEMPFNQLIGLDFHRVEQGRVELRLDNLACLVGNAVHQILHGGVIAAVLDVVGGCSAIDRYLQVHPDVDLPTVLARAATIDLHVDYLMPGKGTHFIASAEVVKFGAQITNVRMELKNEKQKLVAGATGNYYLAPIPAELSR